MDSRKSLEFIRTLIARSENEPEIKEMLKKATLMNKVAQVFDAFDDGHLENLYEMNVNRAGAKMFLDSIKGQGKAPKQVVIQSHPNHVKPFQKYFPSTVPFMIKELNQVFTDWDGTVDTKKKKDGQGFYNDLDVLVSYLKSIGLKAPFKIKVTGKSELTLTYEEDPAESRLLFDNLMAASTALKESMAVEQDLMEQMRGLGRKVAELREDYEDAQETMNILEQEARKKGSIYSKREYELRKLNAPSTSDAYKKKQKEVEKALENQRKGWAAYYEAEKVKQKAYIEYQEKREQYQNLRRDNDLASRVRAWESLDWEGGTPTEQQLGVLISILGGDYKGLIGKLPYKKVITVKISCAIKSSSSGYNQGNFKNLKDFIKVSIF